MGPSFPQYSRYYYLTDSTKSSVPTRTPSMVGILGLQGTGFRNLGVSLSVLAVVAGRPSFSLRVAEAGPFSLEGVLLVGKAVMNRTAVGV